MVLAASPSLVRSRELGAGGGRPPVHALLRRAGTLAGCLPFRASAALGCSATWRLLSVTHAEAAGAEYYSAPAAHVRPLVFSGIRPGR